MENEIFMLRVPSEVLDHKLLFIINFLLQFTHDLKLFQYKYSQVSEAKELVIGFRLHRNYAVNTIT